eukprot:4960664-Amphidinium_carterae.1
MERPEEKAPGAGQNSQTRHITPTHAEHTEAVSLKMPVASGMDAKRLDTTVRSAVVIAKKAIRQVSCCSLHVYSPNIDHCVRQ